MVHNIFTSSSKKLCKAHTREKLDFADVAEVELSQFSTISK